MGKNIAVTVGSSHSKSIFSINKEREKTLDRNNFCAKNHKKRFRDQQRRKRSEETKRNKGDPCPSQGPFPLSVSKYEILSSSIRFLVLANCYCIKPDPLTDELFIGSEQIFFLCVSYFRNFYYFFRKKDWIFEWIGDPLLHFRHVGFGLVGHSRLGIQTLRPLKVLQVNINLKEATQEISIYFYLIFLGRIYFSSEVHFYQLFPKSLV
jgi:hypothetical protein